MADPIYELKPNPTYDAEIRALQDSDPAHASTVFNPLFEKIVNNIHAVKLAGDELAESVEMLEESVGEQNDASNIVLASGKTVETAITDLEKDKAGLASPTFTGAVKAPTPATASDDTTVATTAFVKAQNYASLDSPTLTGTPKAPTPATADSSTQIATTAFVKGQSYAALASPTLTGTPKAPTPATADSSTQIATTAFVKNQSYAPLASPTLTGTPKAPTPTTGDDSTQIATTAFVKTAIGDVANGLFQLSLTFDSALASLGFTVTGGGFTHSGTVPSGLSVTVAVPYPNTTYTITCSGNSKTVATTEYFGVYSVTVEAISTVFANNTWAQIASAAAAGNAATYWKVGDTKDITLTTGETLTLMIYGFNHDDLTAGGKASITFGLKNLMATTRQMEATNTNANGYTGSAMYTWLTGELYNSLPADLQSLIKAVNKKTSGGNQSTTINTNSMKVFLFSEIECFGTVTYSVAGEGSQYPVFTDAASRIKYLTNGAGSANAWWERSPRSTGSTSFCYVNSGGSASNYNASNYYGVCFGFCI